MNLQELYSPVPNAFRSEKDDNTSVSINDTRKSGLYLTLSKLNKLRIMNDARKLEHEKKLEKVAYQYKLPAQTGGPGVNL